MTFRKATPEDIDRISDIYDEIHTEIESGVTTSIWVRSIYPTRKTTEDSVYKGTMFVAEMDGSIVASAKIDHEQLDIYAKAEWSIEVPDDKVMVMHTLAVSPTAKGKGCATEFLKFYEQYARECGCTCLRIDTGASNTVTRALYKKLGFTEVSIIPCVFNGIENMNQVCLEKIL
ncbi:MAG: GNAT family N-acetyltransferase [Clostridiales bacterium]|nr:GNAT family N-acetyltransferase [Clostridiales bacterium]